MLFIGGRLALLVPLLWTASAVAQENRSHERTAFESAAFPTSCKEAVQPAFDRAVALLLSFDEERARRGFSSVGDADPACAMAYWGIAMTFYRAQAEPLPGPEMLAAGREAADKAAATGAPTDRERRFVAAMHRFYRTAEILDARARRVAYRNEMAGLHAALPEDDHAAIFYALSLFATAPEEDAAHFQRRQAAGILNQRMPTVSRYLHVLHYMIHSLDEPDLAELGLPAAREFLAKGPRLAHPLHMPSHIFTRLGMWEESIASNLASEAAANRLTQLGSSTSLLAEALHALDYLEYAYLQTCREAESQAIADLVIHAETVDVPIYSAGYAIAAIPARRALERSNWPQAAGLPLPRAPLPWERFPYALALVHFARGLGAAQVRDTQKARDALSELERIQRALEKGEAAEDPYDWAAAVESMLMMINGVLSQKAGREEEALKLLIAAAELEEVTGKHAVTPGPLLPAREVLADILLATNRPAEALEEYEAVLRTAPKRLRALAGAARAAESAKELQRARKLARDILSQCDPLSNWPEVAMAQAILAGKGKEEPPP